MSALPGNPFAEVVEIAHREQATSVEADATLALAFEQRTATLVQIIRALADTGQRDRMDPYLREINDRLGLGES